MIWMLYDVSLVILTRCVFRLIEYRMGNSGYFTPHEWCIYVFDTLLMLVVLILLSVLQPAKYVPTKNERFGHDLNVSINVPSLKLRFLQIWHKVFVGDAAIKDLRIREGRATQPFASS